MANTVVMAAHARTAVANNRVIRVRPVRDDCNRSFIDPALEAVYHQISLKPVRQVEDDFASGRVEPERMLEDVLLVDAVAKVEALPVGTVWGYVPFEYTV